MIHKLYSLVDTEEKSKEPLYILGAKNRIGHSISMNKGEVLDFTTYFNSVSLKKWKRYTTIETLQLVLHLKGRFQVTFQLYDENGNVQKIGIESESSTFIHSFAISELKGILLGFTLRCLSDTGIYIGGEWDGQFSLWNDQKIGISITTFKREKYVKKTMQVLQIFQQSHSWLSVLVVDNGSTLEEVHEHRFRIVHNRNFGGSGGFTRGMIEYVEQSAVDYVLLMDDDIVLETSALERTFSLLSGLKKEYRKSFLAGAMLSMERPTIQYENTAYWDKFISKVMNHGLDLGNIENLLKNGEFKQQVNQYAGWWYCCIPVQRIREIGYPLPFFIKADDMEYGIRNKKEIILMNGIGVWHEVFSKKISPIIRYYSIRNSLILNHYADECGLYTLAGAVLGRIYKYFSERDFKSLEAMNLAIADYLTGFQIITCIPADREMEQILQRFERSFTAGIFIKIILNFAKAVMKYRHLDCSYKQFRIENMKNSTFWKSYLQK